MRSYELAAMRACLVLEDTAEHREIFGTPGESAVYFRSADELVALVKDLLADSQQRERMAASCYARIRAGGNTYADRLTAIFNRALSA